MKTLNFEKTKNIFAEFALSNEEMISVRGGAGGEPIVKPSQPPIKIWQSSSVPVSADRIIEKLVSFGFVKI